MDKAREYWDQAKGWFSTKSSTPESRTPEARRISDLPLYPEESLSKYRFVESAPGQLQVVVSDVRQSVQEGYGDIAQRYGTVGGAVSQVSQGVDSVAQFLRSEGTVCIPKAVAITAGGMAGFLYGSRRGGFIRQVFYSGVGLGAMASFCYPHETVRIAKSGYAESRKIFDEFQASPPPPKELVVSGKVPPKSNDETGKPTTDRPDVDLYTTRSTK